MILKCIAVDDEPLALDIITDYISQVPFLKLQKTFKDGISVIEFLASNNVDLIFLDIEMGGFQGLNYLRHFKRNRKLL